MYNEIPGMDNKRMEISNNLQLIDYINHGNTVKYIFFWGHQLVKGVQVDKSCFSQWYNAPFEVDGHHYKTAEHFMMAKKAELFSDEKIIQKIIQAKTPGEAKKLGREVKGFNERIWLEKRFDLVVEGNYHKFSQNKILKDFLLTTDNRVLVEASPVDKIWGIGMASDHKDIQNPYKWNGLNLLGYALMQVREKLQVI